MPVKSAGGCTTRSTRNRPSKKYTSPADSRTASIEPASRNGQLQEREGLEWHHAAAKAVTSWLTRYELRVTFLQAYNFYKFAMDRLTKASVSI